ncbi:MAG: C39 family peptidase [Cyanobacteriota bacterium]|nr:C39 family peptidase [Cyanobacteriota bacterium]
MTYILRFTTNSVLKTLPLAVEKLPAEEVIPYEAGTEIPIYGYAPNLQGNHLPVYLEELKSEWIEEIEKQFYCPGNDVEIFSAEDTREAVSRQYPPTRPAKVDLDVPYHSQLNNKIKPSGACNVTSVAMILKYYGIDSRTPADIANDVQLEDVLMQKTLEWDSYYGYYGGIKTRHKPEFLIRLLREWGDKYGGGNLQNSYFKEFASEEDIKQHLAKGNPVIIHGWFTSSGHIIVVKGYDDNKGVWICNDPNGKWLGYKGEYADTSVTGGSVRYSYANVRDVCHIGGGIWCHFPVPEPGTNQTPIKLRILKIAEPYMTGEDVRQVQEALKKANIEVEIDGIFGNQTEEAVKQFQGQNNLTVDGIVGPITLLELGL